MKIFLVILASVFLPPGVAAQDSYHPPLEEAGWEMRDFTVPDQLTELDTGAVQYLVTLNGQGKVTHLKVLSNTFDAAAEKQWRRALKQCAFTNTSGLEQPKKRIRGTTMITRNYCSQPVGTPDQLRIFQP